MINRSKYCIYFNAKSAITPSDFIEIKNIFLRISRVTPLLPFLHKNVYYYNGIIFRKCISTCTCIHWCTLVTQLWHDMKNRTRQILLCVSLNNILLEMRHIYKITIQNVGIRKQEDLYKSVSLIQITKIKQVMCYGNRIIFHFFYFTI